LELLKYQSDTILSLNLVIKNVVFRGKKGKQSYNNLLFLFFADPKKKKSLFLLIPPFFDSVLSFLQNTVLHVYVLSEIPVLFNFFGLISLIFYSLRSQTIRVCFEYS
jgi:hypothetical protein